MIPTGTNWQDVMNFYEPGSAAPRGLPAPRRGGSALHPGVAPSFAGKEGLSWWSSLPLLTVSVVFLCLPCFPLARSAGRTEKACSPVRQGSRTPPQSLVMKQTNSWLQHSRAPALMGRGGRWQVTCQSRRGIEGAICCTAACDRRNSCLP